MNIQAADTSVRKSIVVEAPISRAFKVFTEDFGSFKPAEHNMLNVQIAETVFEPKVGSFLYDRGIDGSVCRWARVLAYEPPSRVLLSWDISPQWQIEDDPLKTSEWEVRFIAEPRNAPGSRSSTAISTAMARAGKVSAMAWPAIRVGRSTCSGTPTDRQGALRSATSTGRVDGPHQPYGLGGAVGWSSLGRSVPTGSKHGGGPPSSRRRAAARPFSTASCATVVSVVPNGPPRERYRSRRRKDRAAPPCHGGALPRETMSAPSSAPVIAVVAWGAMSIIQACLLDLLSPGDLDVGHVAD